MATWLDTETKTSKHRRLDLTTEKTRLEDWDSDVVVVAVFVVVFFAEIFQVEIVASARLSSALCVLCSLTALKLKARLELQTTCLTTTTTTTTTGQQHVLRFMQLLITVAFLLLLLLPLNSIWSLSRRVSICLFVGLVWFIFFLLFFLIFFLCSLRY